MKPKLQLLKTQENEIKDGMADQKWLRVMTFSAYAMYMHTPEGLIRV
jgi:hypothetical protein